jgi:O-antigen/teichoic acid export membrane protein
MGTHSGADEAGGDARVRAASRFRRVYSTAITSVLARFGSVAVLLVTVPMALSHLGSERFGMWMVVSSLGALMAFADFGVGNGVLNRIAAASGRDDDRAIRTAIASGAASLCALGGIIALAALLLYPSIDWTRLFNVTSPLAKIEAGQVVLAFLLCFAVGIPAGLASKVQLGLQQGYEANLWTGIGGLLSFAMVVATIRLDLGTPAMVVSLFGSQQLALLLNNVVFFAMRRPDLRPRLHDIALAETRATLRIGAGFFFVQIVAVIAFRLDALIVTQFFGPVEAGTYATVDRLFSFVALIVGVFLTPLWPAYGEAIARRDLEWVGTTLRRSVLGSVAFTALAGIGIVLTNRLLFDLWLGNRIAPPVFLLVGFALFKVLEAAGIAMAMFLNATNTLRVQVWFAIAMAAVATIAKLMLVPYMGAMWTIWITAGAYLAISIIPSIVIVARVYRRLCHEGLRCR